MGTHRKLSDEQVRAIFLSCEPVREIADEYQISPATAYRIRSGREHPDLTKGLVRDCKAQCRRSVLSKDEVLSIFFSQEPEKVIAKEFKVALLTIRRIKSKDSYPQYTKDLQVGQKTPNPFKKRLSKVSLEGEHDDAIPLNPEIRDLAFSQAW